jgi:hypothetical protein
VLDREGRILKIRGYSKIQRRVTVGAPKGGLRLHASTFEDAAFSLGMRSPEDLAKHLAVQGIMVSDAKQSPTRLLTWFTGLRRA